MIGGSNDTPNTGRTQQSLAHEEYKILLLRVSTSTARPRWGMGMGILMLQAMRMFAGGDKDVFMASTTILCAR